MQFSDLQKKYDNVNGFHMTWRRDRYSKKGNRVMFGELIEGYDTPGWYGGKAYATYITAVVTPKGEVMEHSVTYAEWDY